MKSFLPYFRGRSANNFLFLSTITCFFTAVEKRFHFFFYLIKCLQFFVSRPQCSGDSKSTLSAGWLVHNNMSIIECTLINCIPKFDAVCTISPLSHSYT